MLDSSGNYGSRVYGLNGFQARCLCAVSAAPLSQDDAGQERNRFVVGTLGRKRENEIHLLDFDEDNADVTFTVFPHPKEIWSMTTCPQKSNLLFTCNQFIDSESQLRQEAQLFKLNVSDSGPLRVANGQLEPLATLPEIYAKSNYTNILWDPMDSKRIIALTHKACCLFQVHASDFASTAIANIGAPKEWITSLQDQAMRIEKAAWNPHNTDTIALAMGRNVTGWDTKSNSIAFTIDEAHAVCVKDIDYNPNKPYQMATAGDDCIIRFWDTRQTETPLKEISNHSHWVNSVAYNRFHDQLILTSSSDCLVNLQSIVSISSAASPRYLDTSNMALNKTTESDPTEEEDDEEPSDKPVDGLVAAYDYHEDSVYSVAWSFADPWIFASLSYDGRVVINQVPKDHKYKIIL